MEGRYPRGAGIFGVDARVTEQKCALYRHFDKAGTLLYVGISNTFLSRTLSHRANSHWFEKIVRIEVTWFASREAAFWAEDVAIRQENPKFNRARGGAKGPKSRNPQVEAKRQELLAEGRRLGIKLRGNSCLDVLQYELDMGKKLRNLTRG
ncbi:hypothetical protein [Bradyrhizobium prioriisuperbiae]|uniref:hypothetical protein n=1 Tax=Bradyrhizobium prioriisuperbiae TaxID=2854389 RepID=UPI0028EA78BB|nr:hypothetical protein [Bradyrhizobium prioritasuperba]